VQGQDRAWAAHGPRCRDAVRALTVNDGSSDIRISRCFEGIHTDLPRWSCQPRARTERKPRTSGGSQRTRKPAFTRKAAVEHDTRKDLLSGRSRVRVAVGAQVIDRFNGRAAVSCPSRARWLGLLRLLRLGEFGACGLPYRVGIDEIITRMPTPDEVARLGISTGTPVAEHIRTGYTATDKPVRVMISIIPGDTLILQYAIPT
jgi:hypothetical protein